MGKRQLKTMCPMNCHPTQCGMTVEVEENRLLTLKGNLEHPESHGFLCIRGQSTQEILQNPKRITTPLLRIGERGENRWQACSWEDAYTRIIGTIKQTDPKRVAIWRGHGVGGTGVVNGPLISRFAYLGGYQAWSSAIVCWALGGYGLGLTGILETNSLDDMADYAETIIFWGATLASQPGTSQHLIKARKRGAYVVQIDARRTELSRHVDEVILIRPGTDAALALSMAHVLVEEDLLAHSFLEHHTVGFEQFRAHLLTFTPEWGEEVTGIAAQDIRRLTRLYAQQKPATIALGGSSMYKHQHGWEASRAVSCLPALTGQLGVVGGGMVARHGEYPHGDGLANVIGDIPRDESQFIPSHMETITQAFSEGKVDVLFLLGTNLLSSFANTKQLEQGLQKMKLIVAYDLFSNETIRRVADVVLPATAWLEEMGLKQTRTHLHLMEQALQPEGEARSLKRVLQEMAERLAIPDVFAWESEEAYINALIKPQKHAERSLTVADLRESGGSRERSGLSLVGYPDFRFHTPSGKVEFWSERAKEAGLAPLPSYTPRKREPGDRHPLRFVQGRTLTAFHAFYDEGQALATLAKVNPAPELWLNPQDAQRRGVLERDSITIENEKGFFEARVHVTEDTPPGVVWMRDGWIGINDLTSGTASLSVKASEAVAGIPGGQAAYDAWVEVSKKRV